MYVCMYRMYVCMYIQNVCLWLCSLNAFTVYLFLFMHHYKTLKTAYMREMEAIECVLNLLGGRLWLICNSLKYRWSEFVRKLWKPFPIGCMGILITYIPTVHLFYGIVFKYDRVITVLIVLLWFSIVHYCSLFQYFFLLIYDHPYSS